MSVGPSDDAGIEKLRGLLSGEETARVGRIRSEKNRREYMAAHILARLMLARFGEATATDWRFAAGRHGRPEIEPALNGAGLRFNLSHASGMVACAVTIKDDIGVDVEWLERPNRMRDKIAEKKFSAPEAAYLGGVAEQDRKDVFFSFWTLKESYIKAIGKGLIEPLDGFAFELDPLGISFLKDNGDAACWSFDLHSPSPEHLCALCLAHPVGEQPHITRRNLNWDELAQCHDDAILL